MPTVQGDTQEFRAPLRINISQGTCSAMIERTFNGDQLTNYLEEYLDPTYIENVGLHIRKRKQHPDWNWLFLDGVEVDYDRPRQAPQHTTDNEPEVGWRAIETYVGEVMQGGAIPASAPIYQILPVGSWVEHYWRGNSETMSWPVGETIWVDDQGAPHADPKMTHDADIPVNLAVLHHVVIWYNIPSINETNILRCMGKINDQDNYTSNGFIWRLNRVGACHNIENEGGTLQLVDYEPSIYYSGDGIERYTVRYNLLEQVKTDGWTFYGWNRWPKHGEDPPWTAVMTKGDDGGNRRYLYEKEDYSKLFRL